MSNEHHTPIATGADADAAIFNAPLAELDEAIVETKDDVTSLDGRLTTAEGEIDTLQSNVTSLNGRLTTAEGEIDTLQTNVTTLDSRLDTAEADIDTLQSNVTNLQGRMTTAEGNITTLQTDVTNLDTRLDTAEPEIDTLQSQMSTANSNISNLQGRMTTAEADIDALQANSGWGGVSGALLIDDEIEVGENTENVWVVTGVNLSPLRVINSDGPSQSRAIALINRTTDPWTIAPTAVGSNIRTPNNGYTPKQNEVLFFVRDGRVGQGYWHLVADVRVGNFEDLNFIATSIIEALNTLYNKVTSGGTTPDPNASTTFALTDPNLMYMLYGSATIETITNSPGYPHIVRLIKASGATWSIELDTGNITGPAALANPYVPQENEVVTLVYNTSLDFYHLVPGR